MSKKKILNLPKHVNPTSDDRTACAPYNFVPLPDTIVTAVDEPDQLPGHDTYANAGYPHTGYFDVTLKTMSPVYVRCPLTTEQFTNQEEEKYADGEPLPDGGHALFRRLVRNLPEFFYVKEERQPNGLTIKQPVIPGSSLRGMLRSMLEIIGYGKVRWVLDQKLFFRTVDKTTVGRYYSRRVMDSAGNGYRGNGFRTRVKGGFIKKRGSSWEIEPCDVARVEMGMVADVYGVAVRKPDGTIDRDRSIANLYTTRGPMGNPLWEVTPTGTGIPIPLQHSDVWVVTDTTIDDHRHSGGRHLRYLRVRTISASKTGSPNERKGTLVLTGPVQGQHMAFVFLPPLARMPSISVPNDEQETDINRRLVDLFHDKDQLTPWQAQAFKQNNPPGAERKRSGFLRDGEPVFFLRENGQLTFFGRAQMFRLPYVQSPRDLVPPELRRPKDIDYADAVFGFVRTREELDHMRNGFSEPPQGTKARAYSSRVFITDGALTDGQDLSSIGILDSIITLRTLSTPKPTAFQHYLVQKEPDSYDSGRTRQDGTPIVETRLRHYDGFSAPPQAGETVIRGHKVYWHQGERSAAQLNESAEVREDSTQHTQFKPVKSGVTFTFRIYFGNLSDEELGAMSWTLHPLGDEAVMADENRGYCHSLGMGKPFGMGAVKLNAKLHLTNRANRYGSLFDGDKWKTGEGNERDLSNRETLKELTRKFEEHLLRALDHPKKSPESDEPCTRISDLKRIGMLLKMMEWPGFPAEPARHDNRVKTTSAGQPNTRYMTIELPGAPPREKNEYRDRPVLPDPSAEELFGPLTGQAEPETDQAPTSGGSLANALASAANSKTGAGALFEKKNSSPSSLSEWTKPKTIKPQKPNVTEAKEKVTLVGEPIGGRAKVRSLDGQEIEARFNESLRVEIGARYQAQVKRQDGQIITAEVRALV